MIITNELGTPQLNTVHNCDALRLLGNMASNSVNCVVTSPPYWGLRDYGVNGQIGLEPTLKEFIDTLVVLFREVRRVLRPDGTCWVNMGDSYNSSPAGSASKEYIVDQTKGDGAFARRFRNNHAGTLNIESDARQKAGWKIPGLKPKDLVGQPWRLAFALQDDGWWLRQDIIWAKPNPLPEGVTDRCTKAHEYIFLLTKSERYWYEADAIREPAEDRPFAGKELKTITPNNTAWLNNQYAPGASGYGHNPNGRNKRSVWTVSPEPFSEAHFATFPTKLIEPMILAGCPVGGVVYDPFMGSGTTALVARQHGRNYIGSELNPDYVAIARERLRMPFEEKHVKAETRIDDLPLFAGIA